VTFATSLRCAWEAGRGYATRGFEITRRQPDLYLQLVVLYSLPALAAAALVLYGPHEAPWHAPLVFALPWITVAVAPAVLMLAVEAGHRGERLSPLEATLRGVPWVPRYLWTNAHTTLMFWLPVGSLLLLSEHSAVGPAVPAAGWMALIALVAIHQHVRTMLAPYLVIHGRIHFWGVTRAALLSWHLGGRHFWPLLSTFVLGIAPVALPLAAAFLVAQALGPATLRSALLVAWGQFLWVGIQAIRPFLIPAVHSLYEDLYAGAEQPDTRLVLAPTSAAA
jgi:hypothetical protein